MPTSALLVIYGYKFERPGISQSLGLLPPSDRGHFAGHCLSFSEGQAGYAPALCTYVRDLERFQRHYFLGTHCTSIYVGVELARLGVKGTYGRVSLLDEGVSLKQILTVTKLSEFESLALSLPALVDLQKQGQEPELWLITDDCACC